MTENSIDPAANWSFETKQVHSGQSPDAATNARALPIYQTTSYTFNDTQHAENLFALAEPGNIYTRIMNPTVDTVEQRIAALEGGVAALLLASGQSATTFAILNLAGAGDHIVSSPHLYGGTFNLFHYTLRKLGIDVSFVEDPDDLDQWRAAIQPNTKVLFGETIGNPRGDVLDLPGIASVAKDSGIAFIVDNTIATPFLLNPLAHGANVVIHSATKYLGGHGTSIAGVLVDGGNFDWTVTDGNGASRYPGFTEADASYHGVVYADLGAPAFALKARVQLLRDIGAAPSPFNAFLIAQGIETLSLRMERHISNTQAVAEFLETQPGVESVSYAGLPSSKWHERGRELAPRGTGAVLTFEIAGGEAAARKFIDALTLHSHVANIGDVRSLVIHPWTTTHSQLSEAERRAAGSRPGQVRLAVGIEGIEDILADLRTGFTAAAAAS